MSAFVAAYGLARFCGRGRVVSSVYGLIAAYKAWRWRRSAPDSFTLRRRERLP